ncbi:threonylcarbamoyl-AMP synthase [Dokdonia sinensis]|uniref:L-threonylcarbamoyladenylate synthase n=1 Tax=Dokdonia sinensis TaxID=2479847 RepID=A0A3M0GAB8_9FLAO|nr:L-threonylcarbamoyladenylate synthase [Dokdonia sinensis]RMB59422.1 threonylcarbamoyl-AMP synthase [Dokdonia sinensis]
MKKLHDEALAVLKRGGLILYPTDTVWGIGCDATNADAVDRVYKLKQRTQDMPLICLVSDYKMLNMFVEEIPEVAYDILKFAGKPTTLVLEDPIRIAQNVVAADNTLGFRVCREKFCNFLVKKFRKPIVSTSANVVGETTPMSFKEISPVILEGVDYIVDLHKNKKSSKPSAVIKLTKDGKVTVIRK